MISLKQVAIFDNRAPLQEKLWRHSHVRKALAT